MKRRHLLVIIAVVIFLVGIRFVVRIGPEGGPVYIVTRVIDGDTMEINGKDRIRFLGIDCPEEGEPFHDSATSVLTRLVLGKEVSLKHDFRKRDGYGRLLAYVFLDTLFVNGYLVSQGLARVYLFSDNSVNRDLVDRLIVNQRQAMAANVAVWTVPGSDEEYYIGSRNGFRFHRPDCPSAKRISEANRIYFESRKEAFYKGYSACRNCRP